MLNGSCGNSSISFARPFPTWSHLTPLAVTLVTLCGVLGHLRLFCSSSIRHFHASGSLLIVLLPLPGIPFSSKFFYLGKLVSSRSRSHADPSVKPSLHIYYTFLWNFSSQVWLCTFSLAPQCIPWYKNPLLFISVPPNTSQVSDKMLNDWK